MATGTAREGPGRALPGVNAVPELRGRCGTRIRLARPGLGQRQPVPAQGSASSRDAGGILPGSGALPVPRAGPQALGSSPEGAGWDSPGDSS